jgi:hypothetical protein
MANQSQLYFIQPPGGAGAVVSVFGRIGAVVALAGDYAASLVTNNSSVPGAFVDDALDALDAAIMAVLLAIPPASGVAPPDVAGAGVVGASGAYARADHTHGHGTQPIGLGTDHAVATALLAGFMSALDKAKLDAITAAAAAPPNVAAAGVVGASTNYAREDHVHGHGAQPIGAGTDHAVATALLAGFMSALDKAKLDGIAAGAGPAFLHWGSNSVSATTTTRYMPPGYDSALASLTAIQYRVPAACTIRNLRVRHNVLNGNGSPIVYTVRKNGVVTALTASLASTSSDASDLVNTVSFAAGDLLDIEVTKAASVGTSPNDVTAIVEVAAP